MSKQLYEEALADVKKLKEVAEDNAKRAILEAVTPRIKDLIENELLGSERNDEVDPASGEDDPVSDGPLYDENLKKQPDGALETESDVYEMSYESIKKLGSLIPESNKSTINFSKRFAAVIEATRNLKSSSLNESITDRSAMIASTISELENMYAQLQESKSSSPKKRLYEDTLENCFRTLTQLTERKTMKKNRIINENDLTFTISGLPDMEDDALDSLSIDIEAPGGGEGGDEEGGDELDLGGDDEEGGDEDSDEDEEGGDEDSDEDEEEKMESRRLRNDMIVEIDEGMLRREIGRMKNLREAEETKAQSWGHGAGKVGDGFEDDDMGDPFVDIDLREQQVDQAHSEDGEHGPAEQSNDQSNEPGKTVSTESLRRRLAVEASIQTEAKKKAQSTKKQGDAAQRESQNKQITAQAQMKEAQAQNKQGKTQSAQKKAQQAKKTQQEAQQKKKQAQQMKEAYAFYARRFNESVTRCNKIKGLLSEAARKGRTNNGGSTRSAVETNNLRTKLAETNLFNAKLLYANKVLQNESFTKRQKAEVIERLDEARNVREVTLVYESLAKTLRSSPARRMTESAARPVLGSSSRAERPASTLTEGIEADRWARLAGIIK